MNNQIVSISKGNSKMGAIPSVSLPPCITCNPDAPCFKKCYAVRLQNRYKQTKSAYQKNLDILNNNPDIYWLQVQAAATMTKYFRYHVSGDIPNYEYFVNMCETAKKLHTTNFLAFTKQYKYINQYIESGNAIPENLKIIFSNWGTFKSNNPYNLPSCEIIFKGDEPAENWKICGGNCAECACRGIGCWELKKGETIAIYEH